MTRSECNTGNEPVHIKISGKDLVCLISMDFTRALRHYNDNVEAAYNLLCEYVDLKGIKSGELLDSAHLDSLNEFVAARR